MTTFGETSILTVDHGLGANSCYLFGPYSPASDGTLTDLAVYNAGSGSGASNAAVIACYIDASGAPGALKAKTASFNIDGGIAGWEIHAVQTPVAILASAAYWIGISYGGATNNVKEKTETSGGTLNYRSGITYTAPPDPFGTPDGTLSWRGSTYGIYTPAAQPPPYANVTVTA